MLITVKEQSDSDTADEFTSIEKAFGLVRENEAVGRYLRGLKFLSEKIRGLKIFSGKIRGLNFFGLILLFCAIFSPIFFFSDHCH